jgi:hypothetical protein
MMLAMFMNMRKIMPTLEHRGYLLHYHHGSGETIRQSADGSVRIFATMRADKLSITKLRKFYYDKARQKRPIK